MGKNFHYSTYVCISFVFYCDRVSPALESITWELQYNRYFWLFHISFCIGHSQHTHLTSCIHCHKNDLDIISYIFIIFSDPSILITLLLTFDTFTLLQSWTNNTCEHFHQTRIIFVSFYKWRTHDCPHHS